MTAVQDDALVGQEREAAEEEIPEARLLKVRILFSRCYSSSTAAEPDASKETGASQFRPGVGGTFIRERWGKQRQHQGVPGSRRFSEGHRLFYEKHHVSQKPEHLQVSTFVPDICQASDTIVANKVNWRYSCPLLIVQL